MNDKPRTAAHPTTSAATAGTPPARFSQRVSRWAWRGLGLILGGAAALGLLLGLGLALAYPNLPDISGLTEYRPKLPMRVLSSDGVLLGVGQNRVTRDNDPTAHAEVQAIRAACAGLGDFSLAGATVYASCEPCPLCVSACLWARVERVHTAPSTVPGERSFHVVLVDSAGAATHAALKA